MEQRCNEKSLRKKELEVKKESSSVDNRILSLLEEDRNAAIAEIQSQYWRYLLSIANGILRDEQDAEECVNDVLVHLWNKSLPAENTSFKAYLSKMTRNQAITYLRTKQRKKRGGGITMISYEELADCIPERDSYTSEEENEALREKLNAFLNGLTKEKRLIFMKRYWRSYTVAEIAKQIGKNERYVTNQLYVMRQKLKQHLERKDE